MKKQIFTMIQACLLILMLVGWQTGFSQVNINAHETDVNTNFNGWGGTLPSGFTRNGLNHVGTSASTTGGVYSISGAGFGYQPSQSASNCTLTGTFRNNTGTTITSLQISYNAFQIVNRASRRPNWTVTSSLGNVSGLDWTFDNTTSPSSPAPLSIIINDLNLANGDTFTFTFTAERGDGSGSSPLIGLNNIRVRSLLCDSPTNLAENNVTSTTADFNWDADGLNNFEYVLNQSPSNPTGAGTAINTNSFSTSTLSPSTTYYFHLRQKCSNGALSRWVMVNFTTPAPPCLDPTTVVSSNVTHESADLSWGASVGNTFEYVLDENAAAPVSGTSTTDVTYSASSLDASTTYYFHVRTDCGNGNFSDWTTISFTTDVAPCLAPTTVVSSNVTHESADLSWDASVGNTFEYVLDENAAAPVSGTSTTDVTYSASSLDASTTYYFHVRTDCGNGNFSDWTTISFTTDVAPCLAPTNVISSNVTHESADLSWDASAGNTFEYVLDENAAAPVSGTSTTDVTYSASSLDASTTYYFHIRTDCGNGNFSDWTTISFTTDVAPCLAPTNVISSNVTHESADLSWDASAGNTFEYVLDENAAAPVSGTSTTDVTYSASSLDASTTYYFHIRTDCGNGNFSDWTTISFTTDVAPCLAPTTVVSSNVTHESADLSWDASAGNTFEYVLDENAAAPVSGTSTTDVTYSASSLDASTTYYFHVRTDCGNGNFSDWTTISFTTLPTAGLGSTEVLTFSAYPNPTVDKVTIQTALQEGIVTLINTNGQQLQSIDLSKTVLIDLSGVDSGLYFLNYELNGKSSLVKLIVK